MELSDICQMGTKTLEEKAILLPLISVDIQNLFKTKGMAVQEISQGKTHISNWWRHGNRTINGY